MRQGFRRPTPATIVALVALVVALGRQRLRGRQDRRPLGAGQVAAGQPAQARLGARQPAQAGRPRPTGRRADHRLPDRRAQPRPGAERRLRRRRRLRPDRDRRRDRGQRRQRGRRDDRQRARRRLPGRGPTPFAGACWQTSANETAVTAPVAAAACAAQGGTLPEALQLAAFAQQPDDQPRAAKSGRATYRSSRDRRLWRGRWFSRTGSSVSPLQPTPAPIAASFQ